MEKCCFIASQQDSLFKQLVASLLRDMMDDLKLHESKVLDFDNLLKEISNVEPDMILLEEASPFSDDSYLVKLLTARPGLPVIVVSENSNVMHVVHRESTLLSSSNDLIKVIHQLQVKPSTHGG